MDLRSRSSWKARPAERRSKGNLSRPSSGHWNGPEVRVRKQRTWPHSDCPGLVRGVQDFHMDGKGWSDVAYNFLVCPHGTVYEGRGLNVINAGNGTNIGNQTSHAIYFMAGTGNGFTEAEKLAFRDCVKYIADNTAAPNLAVGHRDHKATECPGDERYSWIRSGMYVKMEAIQPQLPGEIIVNSAQRAQGGFALVGPDGGVFCYGGAPFLGSLPEIKVVSPSKVVAMVWTLDGEGYWLMNEGGDIYAFGTAQYRGAYGTLDASHRTVPRKFTGIVAVDDGGYIEVTTMNDHYRF